MSYIGSGPLYGNYPSESITADGSTSYTMSRAPVSLGGIIVCLDGVKQNSADGAYAISGTTLDFGTAVTAGAARSNLVLLRRLRVARAVVRLRSPGSRMRGVPLSTQ